MSLLDEARSHQKRPGTRECLVGRLRKERGEAWYEELKQAAEECIAGRLQWTALAKALREHHDAPTNMTYDKLSRHFDEKACVHDEPV